MSAKPSVPPIQFTKAKLRVIEAGAKEMCVEWRNGFRSTSRIITANRFMALNGARNQLTPGGRYAMSETRPERCDAKFPAGEERCELHAGHGGPHRGRSRFRSTLEAAVTWPSSPPPETPEGTPETIRCTKCGRECAPIADDDSPATHCVDCDPSHNPKPDLT